MDNLNNKKSDEAQNQPSCLGAVISRILLTCLAIPFGWYAGQIIGFGFITLLQRFGLDDNLFRFLDAVSIF